MQAGPLPLATRRNVTHAMIDVDSGLDFGRAPDSEVAIGPMMLCGDARGECVVLDTAHPDFEFQGTLSRCEVNACPKQLRPTTAPAPPVAPWALTSARQVETVSLPGHPFDPLLKVPAAALPLGALASEQPLWYMYRALTHPHDGKPGRPSLKSRSFPGPRRVPQKSLPRI